MSRRPRSRGTHNRRRAAPHNHGRRIARSTLSSASPMPDTARTYSYAAECAYPISTSGSPGRARLPNARLGSNYAWASALIRSFAPDLTAQPRRRGLRNVWFLPGWMNPASGVLSLCASLGVGVVSEDQQGGQTAARAVGCHGTNVCRRASTMHNRPMKATGPPPQAIARATWRLAPAL
jgi:hypothetical protein